MSVRFYDKNYFGTGTNFLLKISESDAYSVRLGDYETLYSMHNALLYVHY